MACLSVKQHHVFLNRENHYKPFSREKHLFRSIIVNRNSWPGELGPESHAALAVACIQVHAERLRQAYWLARDFVLCHISCGKLGC